MNATPDYLDLRNACSFLLLFTPEELNIIATILSIIIAKPLTIEEQVVVGSFLTALADNILLIAAQLDLLQSAIDEQKELENKTKDKQELDDIKKELKELKDLINKSLIKE